MNKKTMLVIIGITIILSTFVLFAKVNAKENGSFARSQSDYFSQNGFTIKPIKSSQPTFLDVVRCTCNGEACGSSFESNPNVQAGHLIVYCAQLCSCRSHVGFTYETEE